MVKRAIRLPAHHVACIAEGCSILSSSRYARTERYVHDYVAGCVAIIAHSQRPTRPEMNGNTNRCVRRYLKDMRAIAEYTEAQHSLIGM